MKNTCEDLCYWYKTEWCPYKDSLWNCEKFNLKRFPGVTWVGGHTEEKVKKEK